MNFSGSNDTLIKLDRLSFVLPWCSTSLRLVFSFNLCQLYMARPSNRLVLSLDVHFFSCQDCPE